MLTDERAWLRAGSEDSSAFAELYERHVSSVYRYALQMLRQVPDAEDITQEVFVLAWVKRSSIQVVDRSLLPWLLVTAKNLSLNRIKQVHREARNFALDGEENAMLNPHPAAEDIALDQMLTAAIEAAVDELSLTDQTLYHLCITEGLSYKKAAESLGTTHSVVRNKLSRLRHMLRTNLIAQKEGSL